MDLNDYGLDGIVLMDGERIDSTLHPDDEGDEDANGSDVIILTDRRIIHTHGADKRRKTVFAAIQDIDSVEVGTQSEGRGSYVWAGLAFIVAILLFFVIENSTGRVLAPVVVMIMGAYLIIDHLLAPRRRLVTFKAGLSQFDCSLESERASTDIYPFINRLYELKTEVPSDIYSRASRFAPR